MPEPQPYAPGKLNVHRLVTFLLLFSAMLLGGILAGWIPPDPVSIMSSLLFIGFMLFVGYLVNKSGLARFMGWDK